MQARTLLFAEKGEQIYTFLKHMQDYYSAYLIFCSR